MNDRAKYRDHPVSARILRSWRVLSGGNEVRDRERSVLVACSGGVDSVALASAICSTPARVVLVHFEHDMRDREFVERDRKVVERLAKKFDCECVVRSVSTEGVDENTERVARDSRYGQLEKIAGQLRVSYVVTGHHGDDQIETMLMRLMRGTGVRGLRGIHEERALGGARLVRPMLSISRADLEKYCVDMELEWVHDHTNDDVRYLRNRVRHEVLPVLREIEPGVEDRFVSASRACSDVDDFVRRCTEEVVREHAQIQGDQWKWDRDVLKGMHRAILVELVGLYIRDVLDGIGIDQVSQRALYGWVVSLKSKSTERFEHRVGPMMIVVHGGGVLFCPV